MDAHTAEIIKAFASYEAMGYDPRQARLDDLDPDRGHYHHPRRTDTDG